LACLVLGVGLASTGCSSGRYIITEPIKTPLKSFDVLEIKDCVSNQQEPRAVELASSFSDTLARRIEAYNKEHPKTPLFKTVTRSSYLNDRVLVLEPVLLSYEKGSGLARYMIGFGAGKASCTVRCDFKDKAAGSQVLQASFEGELSMGLLGGKAKEAVGKVFDKIIEFLRKNY